MPRMRRCRSSWVVAAVLAVVAVFTATPAGANDSDYLWLLQDQYRFLSPQTLLTEGYKVCAVIDQGVGSRYAAEMVQHDLKVSPAAATDIVSAATVELGC